MEIEKIVTSHTKIFFIEIQIVQHLNENNLVLKYSKRNPILRDKNVKKHEEPKILAPDELSLLIVNGGCHENRHKT